MATSTVSRSFTLLVVLARVVMIATGAWIAYIGYTMLTTPLAIPLTVGVWLVAAATVALGARGKIERGWGGFNADDRVEAQDQDVRLAHQDIAARLF